MNLLSTLKSWIGANASPQPIKGFWHGDSLGALHWACLRSFLRLGHKFELFTYAAIDIPKGVCLKDASEVVPKDHMFFHTNAFTGLPDVAPFADYFRLKVLFEQGGWWCDVDTICLSPHLPKGTRIWARQAPDYRPDSVSNGQLFFARHDWVAGKLLEACEETMKNVERRESLGPELISRVLSELSLPLDMGASASTFYPLRYIEIFKLWLPEFRDEVMEKIGPAVFIPVYQSFPIHLGFDNRRLPPKGSFLNEFIRENAPEFPKVEHDADQFRSSVRKWLKKNEEWAIPRLISVSESSIVDWAQI